MTTSVYYPNEDLGTALPFTADGSVTSYDYLTAGKGTMLECIADQAGTQETFVVNDDGTEHSLGTPTAFTANAASGAFQGHFVDFPTRRIRTKYTNTNTTAGTVRFRARAE